MSIADVVAVLRQYLAGELAASDVEAWADAVEMRDDLAYSARVADVLFELSTPEINGALSPSLAMELVERYDPAV